MSTTHYINFENGQQVGPTFTTIAEAHAWAVQNMKPENTNELAVIRNGEFEVM